MKKVVSILFSFFFIFGVSTLCMQPVHAQINPDTGYAESLESDSVTGAFHVSNVNTNNYSDLVRRILGPVPGVTVTSMDSPLAKQMLAQSAVYNLSSYIAAMYLNPPASTYAFVQDVGQTLGFMPKSAYAQGVGFSGLSALLPIWKVFRNMAYFLLAIVMVVIGFMVMFRKKIDPKTVVTIQNALPRIVVALLLITFSYAIVGLMIDLMYVLIALVGALFQNSGLLKINQTAVLNGQLWGSIYTIDPWQMPFRILGIKDTSTMLAWGGGGTIAGVLASILLVPSVGLIGFLPLILGAAPVLIAALLALGMLLLFLRLFFFFVGVYIKIIIALLFAPFQLLAEAIPGTKAFDSWIRNLTANLLIFPASAALFIIAAVFLNLSDVKQSLWAPPYATILNNTTSIGAVVALGILFMIPTVGKQITDAFKAKPGLQAGGVGELGGMLGAPGQIAFQLFQMGVSKKQMEDLGKNIQSVMGGKK